MIYCIFEAGGTFYIWDQIEDTIWPISQPNTETKIIEVIGERGLKGLGLDALAEVEEEDNKNFQLLIVRLVLSYFYRGPPRPSITSGTLKILASLISLARLLC